MWAEKNIQNFFGAPVQRQTRFPAPGAARKLHRARSAAGIYRRACFLGPRRRTGSLTTHPASSAPLRARHTTSGGRDHGQRVQLLEFGGTGFQPGVSVLRHILAARKDAHAPAARRADDSFELHAALVIRLSPWLGTALGTGNGTGVGTGNGTDIGTGNGTGSGRLLSGGRRPPDYL